MIGIGGSGMIGVAMILQKRGFNVTGSDLLLTPELKELKKLGSKVQLGHEPRLIKNADLVVASSAISKKIQSWYLHRNLTSPLFLEQRC